MVTVELDLLGLNDGDWLLDAGCGEGRHTWEACRRNHSTIIAFDIDIGSLKRVKRRMTALRNKDIINGNCHLLQADINNLPFKNGAFNKIICSEVLEHMPKDQEVVKELVRVLNSNGAVGVSVPHHRAESICWTLSKEYYGFPGGHIRIYETRQVIDLLRSNSLSIYAVCRNHALDSLYWILRCIFGIKRENALIPSLFHKLLVFDIKNGRLMHHCFEHLLNLIIPKSVVIYAGREEHTSPQ